MGNFFGGLTTNKKHLSPEPGQVVKKDQGHHWHNLFGIWVNKYFGILVIFSVVLVLVLCFIFLIKPKYEKIIEKITNNVMEANQLYPKYGELKGYRDLLDNYNALEPVVVEKINGLVVADYQKQALFEEIVYLVYRQGFTIDDIKLRVDQAGLAGQDQGSLPMETGSDRRVRDVAVSIPAANLNNDAGLVSGGTGAGAGAESTAAAPVLPDGLGKVVVDVKISKIDYVGLRSLLNVLENNLRLLDVTYVDFKPADQKVNLKIETYYFK